MNLTQPIGLHRRSLTWGVGLGNRCTANQRKGRKIISLEGGIRNIEKNIFSRV